ncbi:phage tail tape measure protein [Alkalihalobacterium alkalinitrilicum]|uniref:phage tail tape measure protein n=1 Tax=Alkalihalobacterium alkalinitrilicum TaxID=427920 RepID=UPI000995A6F2|nr:phage tail tape measure protein [Alkalihalobacterium alkalinitrilicum]
MAKNPEVKVKFSVFNKEFNDGMREIGRESSNLRKEFKLKESQLKQNGTESDLLKNKVNYLSKEHELASNKVKATEEQLAKAKAMYGENSTEVERLNSRLLDAKVREQQFANELAEATKELADQEDKVKQLSKTLDETGGKMKDMGGTLTKGVTLPIVAAGGAAAKFAIDQETAFAKVSTLLDESSTDMEEYRKNVRDASSDMGVAFGEYSEAVYQSISAGIDQGEAVEFSGKMAKLAKGGFTSMTTATDLTTTALNSYGLSIEETDNVMDMLINTQNQGKTTVDELASSMGKVIPTAKSQNVGLDQLSTGYAVLTKNGIATAEAGTYMNAMFGELGKSGSKTDKILREKTGKSFAELQAEGMNTADVLGILQQEADGAGLQLSDMFGSSEAGRAAMVLLTEEGNEFNEILASMGDVAGATDAAFEKMNDTTGQKLKQSLVKAQNAAAEFGDVIAPIIGKAADIVSNLIGRFSNLSPTMKTSIVVVAALAAAIGPLLVVLGTIIQSIGVILPLLTKLGALLKVVRVAKLALLGPIGLVVAAIVGLIAYFVHLYKTNENFRNKVNQIWNKIKEIFSSAINNTIQKFNEMRTKFTNTANQIWTTATNIFNNVKNAIMNPIETAKSTVLGIIEEIKSAFSNMKINIPKPKLPKINVSMEKNSWGIPYPKFDISWFKTGGVFTRPVVAGNAGFGDVAEAIVPFEGSHAMRIAKLIAEAQNRLSENLANKQDGNNNVLVTVEASDVIMDGRKVGSITWKQVKEFIDRDDNRGQKFRGE